MKRFIIFMTFMIFITFIIFIFRSNTPSSPNPIPTPTPGPRPKTFIFDSSTDLKKELESINPQVLDSDFEEK